MLSHFNFFFVDGFTKSAENKILLILDIKIMYYLKQFYYAKRYYMVKVFRKILHQKSRKRFLFFIFRTACHIFLKFIILVPMMIMDTWLKARLKAQVVKLNTELNNKKLTTCP
jgi:hypothetical protein